MMRFVDRCPDCLKVDTASPLFPAPADSPDPCRCVRPCYWSPMPDGMYADRARESCTYDLGHEGRHSWADEDEGPRQRVIAAGLGYRPIPAPEGLALGPSWADDVAALDAARDAERTRYAATIAAYERVG